MSPFQAACLDSLRIILATIGGIFIIIVLIFAFAILLKEGALSLKWKRRCKLAESEARSLQNSLDFHMRKLKNHEETYRTFSESFRAEKTEFEQVLSEVARDVCHLYAYSSMPGRHFDKRRIALRLFTKLVPGLKSPDACEQMFIFAHTGEALNIEAGDIRDILK